MLYDFMSSMFKSIIHSLLITIGISSSVQADESRVLIDTSRHYGEAAVKVDIECLEDKAKEFLGSQIKEFNSKVGFIGGENINTGFGINIVGEKAENPFGYVQEFTIGRYFSDAILGEIHRDDENTTEASVQDTLPADLLEDVKKLENTIFQCYEPNQFAMS
jgi:hypothetical protein